MARAPETKQPEGQSPVAAEARPEGAGPRTARVSYAGDLGSRTVFADGIHGVSLRSGVARIDFYQAVLPTASIGQS